MIPLPTQDLRSNVATWAVPMHALPGVGVFLRNVLPLEPFDPTFRGQALETTYLDTAHFALRKARLGKRRYLTLRIRCYGPNDTYALSAKTESSKYRAEIEPAVADLILQGGLPSPEAYAVLPADLQARLCDLAPDEPVVPVVRVRCRRYAVEDESDRYTLDVDVRTDLGKCLPFAVLEFKSTGATAPGSLLGLRPLKLSKFLWATEI